ncbi:MAG: sulfotransferase [Novosphingobium sp.]|nr:sulfotransferase [Novosphingobium sp.]
MASQAIDFSECPGSAVLKALATAETGLEDFGDPARDAGLDAYVASVSEDSWPAMTTAARVLAVDYMVHQLATRLRLIADRKAHPEIAAQEITAPLIVVGPPRSGSTLLQTLLSLDPDNMTSEHWICREPSPPLALGAPSPERLEAAEKRMMQLFELIPDVFITHPYMIEEGAGALAECGSDILSLAFTSQQLWCFWGGDSYRDYLTEADHSAAMQLHREFLQHCQWGNTGKRWALKGSDHMLWLGELAAQYPDARLIWTHRDLSQQLASLASVQAILRGMNGQPVTPEIRAAQGRKAMDLQWAAIEKGMCAREQVGDSRFIDISYHDMMSDHVETVRQIYEWSGLTMSDAHIDAIREWQANNAQTKHGTHKHSPEEFGMNPDQINAQFAAYTQKFGFGFGIRPGLTV